MKCKLKRLGICFFDNSFVEELASNLPILNQYINQIRKSNSLFVGIVYSNKDNKIVSDIVKEY